MKDPNTINRARHGTQRLMLRNISASTSMMMLSLRRAVAVRSTTTTRTAALFFSTLKDEYEYVKVELRDGGVGLITLHRPKALNALCDALFDDLIHAARALDSSPSIGCMVLTGSSKAFAAGADISEMSTKEFDQVYKKVRLERRMLVICHVRVLIFTNILL
jgi:1,4-dihydroxy-2-naphthoyl-CoA synthase